MSTLALSGGGVKRLGGPRERRTHSCEPHAQIAARAASQADRTAGNRLAAGPAARRAAGVEMCNHFPGRSELLDDKEASRLLHQHALALVVHVAGSNDKTDRDTANELVLVDRERNKFLTSGVRTLTHKSHDLGAFAAFRSPFVDLPPQSLIERGLPLALLSFPVCSHRSTNSRMDGIRSGESLHDRAGRTAEHAQIVGATREGTLPTGPEQAVEAAGTSSRGGRTQGRGARARLAGAATVLARDRAPSTGPSSSRANRLRLGASGARTARSCGESLFELAFQTLGRDVAFCFNLHRDLDPDRRGLEADDLHVVGRVLPV